MIEFYQALISESPNAEKFLKKCPVGEICGSGSHEGQARGSMAD